MSQSEQEALQPDFLDRDNGFMAVDDPTSPGQEEAGLVVAFCQVRGQLHRGAEQRLLCQFDRADIRLIEGVL